MPVKSFKCGTRLLALRGPASSETHRRRIGAARRSIIAHVGPQPPVLVLPRPGSSTGTGVSSACSFSRASDIAAERLDQRLTRRAAPPTQSASVERSSSMPSGHRSAPAGTAAGDRRTWRTTTCASRPGPARPRSIGRIGAGCLHDAGNTAAGELRPHVADHLEAAPERYSSISDTSSPMLLHRARRSPDRCTPARGSPSRAAGARATACAPACARGDHAARCRRRRRAAPQLASSSSTISSSCSIARHRAARRTTELHAPQARDCSLSFSIQVRRYSSSCCPACSCASRACNASSRLCIALQIDEQSASASRRRSEVASSRCAHARIYRTRAHARVNASRSIIAHCCLRRDARLPVLRRSPPIDAFEQHRQLRDSSDAPRRCVACGHTNRPRSRRFAYRFIPSPLHHSSFTRSPRLPRNTNTSPENGLLGQRRLHQRRQAVHAFAACRSPRPRSTPACRAASRSSQQVLEHHAQRLRDPGCLR